MMGKEGPALGPVVFAGRAMTSEPQHPLDPRRRQPAEPAKREGGRTPPGKGRPGPRPGAKKAGKTGPGAGGGRTAKTGKYARGVRTGQGTGAKKPRARRPRVDAGPPPGKVRIQKVLSEAGLASRRACEEMVLMGRVSVNGEKVTELPCFVDPDADTIAVDGTVLKTRPEKKTYLLLNKPRGVVCTNSDPQGRPRAIDLVAQVAQRVYPVGRLDTDSTGLIFLTNDGEFANRVTHPRYGLVKTYVVEVEGRLEGPEIEKLKAGMFLDGTRTQRAGVKVLTRSHQRTLLEIRLNEGRNREIRRLLARLGYKVRGLRRVAIGPVSDKGIKTGRFRPLTRPEIDRIYRETDEKP